MSEIERRETGKPWPWVISGKNVQNVHLIYYFIDESCRNQVATEATSEAQTWENAILPWLNQDLRPVERGVEIL